MSMEIREPGGCKVHKNPYFIFIGIMIAAMVAVLMSDIDPVNGFYLQTTLLLLVFATALLMIHETKKARKSSRAPVKQP